MGNNSSTPGASFTPSDAFFLTDATRTGSVDVVRLFLRKNPALVYATSSSEDRATPWHVSAAEGHDVVLRVLIDTTRANAVSNTFDPLARVINQQNAKGQTPLMLACGGGNSVCVRLLLEGGAHLLVADAGGLSALHYAALHNRPDGKGCDCVDLLLAHMQQQLRAQGPASAPPEVFANVVRKFVDTGDTYGRTALHYAAWSGNTRAAHALWTVGADICATTAVDCYDAELPCNTGTTPLHFAAMRGHQPLVVLLLAAWHRRVRQPGGQMPQPFYGRGPHSVVLGQEPAAEAEQGREAEACGREGARQRAGGIGGSRRVSGDVSGGTGEVAATDETTRRPEGAEEGGVGRSGEEREGLLSDQQGGGDSSSSGGKIDGGKGGSGTAASAAGGSRVEDGGGGGRHASTGGAALASAAAALSLPPPPPPPPPPDPRLMVDAYGMTPYSIACKRRPDRSSMLIELLDPATDFGAGEGDEEEEEEEGEGARGGSDGGGPRASAGSSGSLLPRVSSRGRGLSRGGPAGVYGNGDGGSDDDSSSDGGGRGAAGPLLLWEGVELIQEIAAQPESFFRLSATASMLQPAPPEDGPGGGGPGGGGRRSSTISAAVGQRASSDGGGSAAGGGRRSTRTAEVVPDCFLCPLTCKLFRDPVVAADGVTYEREAIERHLHHVATSPVTRQRLPTKLTYTNTALLRAIEHWSGSRGAAGGGQGGSGAAGASATGASGAGTGLLGRR